MNDLTINNPNQIQSLEVTRSDTYNTFIKQYNQFLAENDYKINMDSINKYFQECIDFYSIRSLGVIKAAIKEGLEKTFSNSPYYFQLKYAIDKAFTEIKVGKADNKISSENLLTEEEIDQLLIGGNFYDNRVKKEIEIFPDKDLYLLIQFLKETGLRISELITLENEYFHKKGDFYYFSFIGKGRKERKNFILGSILEETKKHYKGSIYLFEFEERKRRYSKPEREKTRKWISHKLNSYSKKVIGREVNPHDFRHYFATRLLKEGKSLKAIAQWLGHSSTSITSDMYIHDELSPNDLY